MDKQNYTLKGIDAQALKQYFFQLQEELRREIECRILKRKRVLKRLKDLILAIYLYFEKHLSFQRLSDVMSGKYGITMSDTAWRKQILKAAPILWEEMRILQEKEVSRYCSGDDVLGFLSAYAIDATDIPAQGGTTTARRVHTQFSITEHRCSYAEITDCHGGESLKRFPLQKDALYFADRAYGKTPQLAYALEQQAHFLIRISPHQVTFFSDPECRKHISFPDILKGTVFSTVAYFKHQKSVYYVRIFGIKLPEQEQARAEKRVRRRASRKQQTVAKHTFELAKWLILATSLPDTFSDNELAEIYCLRWQIELHFKRVKSFLNFRKFRRSSDIFQDCMGYLWLALSSLIALLQLRILFLSNFSISDFNAFSLALHFLP